MKQFLFILGILTLCIATNAQSDGNGPERFYNIESYKANITLTFQYQLNQSETEYSRSVNVSQTFQHFFKTAPGQISAGDMFQIERGDKVDGESQKKSMMEGVDMNAVSQAMKNSGIEPSVMDQLKKTKRETGSYNMGFDKYKMWMTIPVSGGSVASSIYSKFYDEENGSMHCGEGAGIGSFRSIRNYSGSAKIDAGQSDIINPNGFILLLNLANNSYSFSANVKMPQGFEFKGNTQYRSECGTSTDKPLTMSARSFINIRAEKEGLVYKSPLPEGGMVLSGSEIITDSFGTGLDKEGANWSVKIDWTISPADR